MILRQVYIIFLGVLLALFVNVGISAFYPQPQMPKQAPYITPMFPSGIKTDQAQQKKMMEQEQQWQNQMNNYQQQERDYKRNVSIISLIAAIIFLIISLVILSQVVIITDGFLLGGLFTLIYSIFMGFGSEDSKYRFIVVAVSLGIALCIGYVKFIKASGKKS